jgi:uncharacterized membrane protein YecN with MAPEG domain
MTTMMPSMITAIYAAILAVIAAVLTINVIVTRVRTKVNSGDGGVAVMAQAIRAHGNFAEHTPIALIAIGFAEAAGSPALVVHVLGIALVVGRLAAAYALNRTLGLSLLRQIAASITILVLIGAAVAIFVR